MVQHTEGDRLGRTKGHVEHRVTYSCEDCDDFELEKNYSGRAGTPAEEEFDRVKAPDECPACGGDLQRVVA